MRAFKIGVEGIEEVDLDLDELLTDDVTWDCISLDNGHDVWCNDFGLIKEHPLTAIVDDRHRVPLPAVILAVDDEGSVGATLTMKEVRTLVRIDRKGAGFFGPQFEQDDSPVIGYDSVTDFDGVRHPWRVVVAFQDGVSAPKEWLVRIPEGEYQTSTMHPVHGDLTKLPFTSEQQAEAICLAMRLMGHDVTRDAWQSSENAVERRLEELGVLLHCIVVAEPDDPADYDDVQGIGGLAGHEVSNLLDDELLNRRLDEWHDRHVAAERPQTPRATAQGDAASENHSA